MINKDNHSQNNVAKQETMILFKLYSLVLFILLFYYYLEKKNCPYLKSLNN
jgi:hypothetical protein